MEVDLSRATQLRNGCHCLFKEWGGALERTCTTAHLLACTLFLGAPVLESHEDTTVEQVRRANRATVDSLTTFACRATLSSSPHGPMASISGAYTRSGSNVRVVWRMGEQSQIDTFVKDSLRYSYQARRRPDGQQGYSGNITPYDGGA